MGSPRARWGESEEALPTLESANPNPSVHSIRFYRAGALERRSLNAWRDVLMSSSLDISLLERVCVVHGGTESRSGLALGCERTRDLLPPSLGAMSSLLTYRSQTCKC